MSEKLIKKTAALLLSLAMTLSLLPLSAADAFAASTGTAEEILSELGRQMQNKDVDPYAYRGDSGSLTAEAAYPASFDLRNVKGKSYVTPVKFQNPFGTCWGFAAITAAETSILGNDEINQGVDAGSLDLSEKHLVWFTYQTVNDKSNPQYGEGNVYFGPAGSDILNLGGWTYYATSLYATGMGPVREDAAEDGRLEYHGRDRLVTIRDGWSRYVKPESEITDPEEREKMYCYSGSDDWSLSDEDRYLQSYRLKQSYILPTPAKKKGRERLDAINAIKNQLISKRAVEIAFSADVSDPVDADNKSIPTQYLSSQWGHYTYDDGGVNHAVTIVGWDDNFSKKNFRHKIEGMSDLRAYSLTTPAHDGAWLVKNSWGSAEEEFPNRGPADWGIRSNGVATGYFWLSYDDRSVYAPEAMDFDLSNVDDEYLIYQHDYMPVSEVSAAFEDKEIKTVNVFTSELPSRIEQLSCETLTPGTEVRYELFRLYDDAHDATDGQKLAEINATYDFGGFHKEDVPEPPILKTGERFAVAVTQKTPDNEYAMSVKLSWNKKYTDEYNEGLDENEKSYSYSKGVINEGESMFSVGDIWFDLSDQAVKEYLLEDDVEYLDMDNFPIKVYASEAEAEPEPEPEPIVPDDKTKQMGEDGTPFGRGASAEAAEAAALAWSSDADPAGTRFAPLMLRSRSRSKKSVTLLWNRQQGAASYAIYGAKSGGTLKRTATADSNSYRVSDIAGAALKKGSYYKFMIVALDADGNVLNSSAMIHVATKGGRYSNPKKVKISKPKKAKLSLRAGKSYKIKAKASGSRIKKKRGLRYESSDTSVAVVSAKGRVKAVSPGSCSVRVYAQNGLYKTIRLKVK